MEIISVPTINRIDTSGFVRLFEIQSHIMKLLRKGTTLFELRFDKCNFLPSHALVILGGIVSRVEISGGTVTFNWNTLSDNVHMNLKQNGFFFQFGGGTEGWQGNSVPYMEDVEHDKNFILNYLEREWLRKEWLNVSNDLRNEIIGKVWEIYTNAFEHSTSGLPTISCGQYYPSIREIRLAIADFGIGIPSKVRNYKESQDINGSTALKWAFQEGSTTKDEDSGPGGLGLGILRDFIKVNKGSLEVYSLDGHATINKEDELFQDLSVPFQGTIFDITLRSDFKSYFLKSEIQEG